MDFWISIVIVGASLLTGILILSHREIYEFFTGIPWDLRKFAKESTSDADEKSKEN
jgi:hypothetical protein